MKSSSTFNISVRAMFLVFECNNKNVCIINKNRSLWAEVEMKVD